MLTIIYYVFCFYFFCLIAIFLLSILNAICDGIGFIFVAIFGFIFQVEAGSKDKSSAECKNIKNTSSKAEINNEARKRYAYLDDIYNLKLNEIRERINTLRDEINKIEKQKPSKYELDSIDIIINDLTSLRAKIHFNNIESNNLSLEDLKKLRVTLDQEIGLSGIVGSYIESNIIKKSKNMTNKFFLSNNVTYDIFDISHGDRIHGRHIKISSEHENVFHLVKKPGKFEKYTIEVFKPSEWIIDLIIKMKNDYKSLTQHLDNEISPYLQAIAELEKAEKEKLREQEKLDYLKFSNLKT